MSRFLIVGLGNPGKRYQNTRHNLGFMVLDVQAKKMNRCFSEGPGAYHWMRSEINDSEVVFIKPMTYMNRSGVAVADVRLRLNVSTDKCLVLLDDLALPLGQLRLRAKGSDGGHKGLGSVMNYLHSQYIPRLRMGIGHNDEKQTIRYVLSPFFRQNEWIVKQMVEQAVQTIDNFVVFGIHQTMNIVNASN